MAAKTKWKNLRDTFRVELKKTKRYSNPDTTDGPNRSLWAYYEDMYFLKGVLRTRRVYDFPDPPTLSEVVENMAENVKVEEDPDMTFSPIPLTDDNDTRESPNIVIESVTSLQSHSEDVDTTNEQVSKRIIKRKRFDDGDDDDQDDDLLFFRSLLPFVKRLDQDKKLLFRMNVQQMLYNQLYS